MHRTDPVGLIPRIRTWLFGPSDSIERQLRHLARKRARSAGRAHMLASMLIILFSFQALNAFASDQMSQVVSDWTFQHSLDISGTIAIVTTLLIVVCMDAGMLHAAEQIRSLKAQSATPAGAQVDYLIVIATATVEASTFVYAGARFDHPASPVAWGLILMRAVIAPVLVIYLGLVHPSSVTPKDILHEAELASGGVTIREVAAAARDETAPLSAKMALYRAAKDMSAEDAKRLDRIMMVLEQRDSSLHPLNELSPSKYSIHAEPTTMDFGDMGSASNGELLHAVSPSASHEASVSLAADKVDASKWQNDNTCSDVRTLTVSEEPIDAFPVPRADAGRSRWQSEELRHRRETAVRQILASEPAIGQRELARRIEVETGEPCALSTAHQIYLMVMTRHAADAVDAENTSSAG